MKEQETKPISENGLEFAPESLQSFYHILKYEQNQITEMARNYARLPASKQIAFKLRSFYGQEKNRLKYVYYSQEAIKFEDKLGKSIFLRTRQIPIETKATYVLWATATAILKIHKDNLIENSFPDQSFISSRGTLSRKLIQNSRRIIYMEENKVLSNEWTNNIAIQCFHPPIMENGRVFKIANVLNEYVNNPVYNPEEIVFADEPRK